MKRIFLLLLLLVGSVIHTMAENYIESYNIASEKYVDEIQDVQVIRRINGGTVITPIFDETCPNEMKAPFAYACKIVEEYIPPCLPLKVEVSCGRTGSSSSGAISRVRTNSRQHFGKVTEYKFVQMSMIKGVILAELSRNSTTTFLDSVPDVKFLTNEPDISITYNNQKLNEFYFSLDTIPGEKYDFVSLAIRDLLIGLGISSGYNHYTTIGGLQNPQRDLTPFEYFINKTLGNYDNPTVRLAKATKGELELKLDALKSLKLYAPTTWVNGVSLNYFIPQDDSCVSKILTHNFCKGMVKRSLSDNYSHDIFTFLLGWKADYVSGTSAPSPSSSGSTSLLMPYNGSISIENKSPYNNIYNVETHHADQQHATKLKSQIALSGRRELEQYVNSFHPFLTDENNPSADYGTSVSVLKKDGTWDVVKFIQSYFPGETITYSMSDWTFHFDDDQYARTVDGYLRARITVKYNNDLGGMDIKSTFFVVDYLPQKVRLGYDYIPQEKVPVSTHISNTTENNVRLYFSNTEGVDRIVIECKREGFRIPSKIQITNVKKGYFDTTIDRNTTFTALSYNNNGYTRGVPVTVEYQPASVTAALSFDLQNDAIMVKAGDEAVDNCNYSIAPLSAARQQAGRNGMTNGAIDISTLADGLYVLTAIDEKSGLQGTFKFRK